ncbi:ABC transporter ATP-binding protein [Streptococcus gallolyticus]|uniref:ABC transporter ATP-binding protein n=1 Tax=Streptococcus hepaticus TaxID=3349163 RepID=UPI001C941957|nr:ABC transporter ATP-binding protein [Streptococcus gallolyticus]MBY5040876.1 ABC transporter ATP-binding protein [Streptococcus gallolyticus]
MKLIISSISKLFDQKIIFQEASFSFEKGKIYGLLGRNGAGKTTLFNCIAKNLPLDGGQISLQMDDHSSLLDYDNTDIALSQATPQLPAFMTAYEFIRFFMDIHKDKLKDQRRPEDWLLLAGIAPEDQHRLLKDFSHGMQNKVQMITSLIAQPAVLLLDEPLTSFDPVAAHEFKELIRAAKKDSIIIFSTHVLQLAQDLCDEIVLLHHQVLQEIPADRLHDADFEQEIVDILSDKQTGESL